MAVNGGNILAELRNMAGKDKLSTEQALPLLMAVTADIYDELLQSKERDKKTDERLDKTDNRIEKLESRDQKIIARWGAIGVIVGASIAGVFSLIIALIS